MNIVILAAGMGKRMHSDLPKVLHPLAGKPLVAHVLSTARLLSPATLCVIYGHGGDQVPQALAAADLCFARQEPQLGTGHALLQALPHIPPASLVLVLYADVPLIQTATLQALITKCSTQHTLALLLATMTDPTGLGRIVRNEQQQIYSIVEEKDASKEQRQINEIYSGICCASASDLIRWLPKLNNDNAQGEYYLTEIIAMAVAEQLPIESLQVTDNMEISGVNNRLQLQQLERVWQQRIAAELMLSGVTLADASRIDVRGELSCGIDVFIDVNSIFSGKVVIGDGCVIGANCHLNNVTLGADCEILANSVLDQCYVGDNCHIGPFARLRPGTQLAADCKIGNFVETKNAVFDQGSKASHLSYLTIGKNVNIGAGTITCNYDGVNKHQTIIEDGVFVGSDTQLIAPVTVGENATIGAGSTIRKNVPAGELTLTEAKQKTIYGWRRPSKRVKSE